jgi:hypothetical protein
MITIETFFILSAVVVLIGLVVWRRDLKSGRIMRPKALTRARSVRNLFADTRSQAMPPPPADTGAPRSRNAGAASGTDGGDNAANAGRG